MSNRRRGFTIVELTIAVAFLSVLMLAILIISISAGKLYVKGNTNKAINQAGRDFTDSIRRDFLAAGIDTIVMPADADAGTPGNPLKSGRICLGNVAYLWNSAALLNDNSAPANNIKIRRGSATGQPIKFVRITNTISYCVAGPDGSYPKVIPATDDATDLLGASSDYSLYTISMRPIDRKDQRGMYELSYTLGPVDVVATEVAPEGYVRCKTDDKETANFNYCSVSEFDTLIRIGGVESP